ncbi:SDR family NAD(P)-dependent oxidoreductase [Nocardia cyriacigeorgica]|uniref:SDR family NAD(P)-dependent oxidoreductase n=1 Tax=Nocardia cyriacigeorgica TaxID=135487 RepID=A0A5R8PLD5_9NOCA|nr:type I polyketide synthase [Nocardia cyriacigeorgica]TLG18064.1 SDR family NAD(P)-dependent oxidoreductase [Nocardia cyriacigeorgica]
MSPPHPASTPVSIIGIGCRLPGADGPHQFWQLLLDGRDATGMPPQGRAGHQRGGYLEQIDRFDNEFFGISGREAAVMDPQQRIALEVAVEALDDAGIGYRARGSAGAVIFGACAFEHGGAVLGHGGYDPPYAVTGSASSIIANRLSYALDLRGPSLVIDTACSSSLVAVDLAVRLLADGTVPFAVVGGVNLTLLPHTGDYLAEAGFLSPTGRCAPFDAAADGYVRGEGCAVVVLQHSVDARREGNRAYAEIVGSAVGSDGRSNGLYAPNGRAQREVIRTAWDRAGLTPGVLSYLECHGTGTALGDAVEIGALTDVREDADRTTWIGSLKSSVGHLEAAAGVAGLIRAALAVHHGTIPPTANFTSPNPLLRLTERGLRVPDMPIDWSGVPAVERYAGVSSFGFGGTNAHVALHGAPRAQQRQALPPALIPLAGRDAGELREAAVRLARLLDPEAAARDAASGINARRDADAMSELMDDADSTAGPVIGAGAAGLMADADPAGNAAAAGRTRSAAHAGPSSTRTPDAADAIGAPEPRDLRGDCGRVARRGEGVSDYGHDGAVRDGTSSTGGDHGRSTPLPALAVGTARLIGQAVRAAVIADSSTAAVAALRGLTTGAADPRVIGPAAQRRPGGLLFLFSGQGGQHARMGRGLAARYPVFARALTAAADAVSDAGGPRVWTPRRGFGGNESGRDATDFVQPALFVYQFALSELLAAFGVRPDGVAGHSLGEVAAAAVSGALTLEDAARVVVARSRALARLDGHGAMAVLEAEPDQVALMVEPLRASAGIAAVNGPRSVVVSGTKRSVEAVVRRARRRGLFARRVAVDFAAHSPQVDAVLPEFAAAIKDIVARMPQMPVYSTTRAGRVITAASTDVEYWLDNARGTVELAQALRSAADSGISTVLEIGPHPQLLPAVRDHDELGMAAHAATDRDDEAAALLTCLAQLYVEGRALDWSALGGFSGAPRRRWRRRRFPLLAGAAATGVENFDEHIVGGVALVPAAYWLRRFTRLARECGRAALAEVVVHEPLAADATAEVMLRRESESVRAEAPGAGTLAKARLTDGPTPGDIIAWMRVVDANRACRSGLRVIAPTAFYAALRERGLAYGPAFRPLRTIAGSADRAIGTLAAAEAGATATIDGCLHLLAALDHAALPADAVPLPIAIAAAWLSPEPDRRLCEVHALLRTRTATGLIGDIIATDQHGAPALALTGVQIRFTRPGGSPVVASENDLGIRRGERIPEDANAGASAGISGTWHTDDAQLDPWQPTPPDDTGPEAQRAAVSGRAPVHPNRSSYGTVERTTRYGATTAASTPATAFAPIGATRPSWIRELRAGEPYRETTPSISRTTGTPTVWWREVWEPFAIDTPASNPGTGLVDPAGRPTGDEPTHTTSQDERASAAAGPESGTPSALGQTGGGSPTDPGSSSASGRDTQRHTGIDPHGGRESASGGAPAQPVRPMSTGAEVRRVLVVGESETAVRLTRVLDRRLPSERVAREVDAAGPVVDAVLAGRTAAARTAVIVVWPADDDLAEAGYGAVVDQIGRVLDLIQRVIRSPAAASLTMVLPELPGVAEPTVIGGVAGLLRSVQLESGPLVRLVWADERADPEVLAGLLTDMSPGLAAELRLTGSGPTTRRFVPVEPEPAPVTIDPHGTYVVCGGLGALGSIAVRWLLDSGARDVVVPTRAPRPVPPLLDGREDRIVVVRCDTADRTDLDHALRDIRECGSTIRGVVHAAGALEDALIEDVTVAQLDRMFAPKLAAATHLIELTAADPTDFVLLFSSAAGAFGAPGQSAYACANAAMDALTHRYPQRRILSIGWGLWDTGLAESAGGASHLRRAGIVPFDADRGAELLHQAIGHQASHLVALDYRTTADPSPVAQRLAELLAAPRVEVPGGELPFPAHRAGTSPGAVGDQRSPRIEHPARSAGVFTSAAVHFTDAASSRARRAELITLIHRILANTLRVTPDTIDTAADFNDLGLTSLLAVDMRRALEQELPIRIATAELFRYPTVESLAAALAERIEPPAVDHLS